MEVALFPEGFWCPLLRADTVAVTCLRDPREGQIGPATNLAFPLGSGNVDKNGSERRPRRRTGGENHVVNELAWWLVRKYDATKITLRHQSVPDPPSIDPLIEQCPPRAGTRRLKSDPQRQFVVCLAWRRASGCELVAPLLSASGSSAHIHPVPGTREPGKLRTRPKSHPGNEMLKIPMPFLWRALFDTNEE